MRRLRRKVWLFVLSILLSGCTLPGLGGDARAGDIVVAGGNTTERQILAEVVVQMIEHELPEANVSLINNMGSTLLILQTMRQKNTNISGAMYTGTSLTGELGLNATSDPDLAFREVVSGYHERFSMVWFPSYGFANTYAFMVTRQFAQEHNLKTVSDLARLAPSLRAGVDMSWIDRQGDGYEDFKRLYGFDFASVYPMEIGLVYNAVAAGEMDLVLGYSTDGRIEANDLVILTDDLKLFPPYDASPVITEALLQAYPQLETILLRLEDSIDESTMQSLNRRADEDKVEPSIVARDFLQTHNYFADKEVVPLSERPLYREVFD